MHTVQNVLASLAGNYQILYYYNGTSWISYAPERPSELDDLNEFNDWQNKPYWINTLASSRIQIQ